MKNLNLQANKERFNELLKSTNRENIETLINWLENKTDFYSAPSSTVFHNNFEGGLLAHSLNVFDLTLKIYEDIKELNPEVNEIPLESIIISALLHDVCKVNFYEKAHKWRKDADDRWEQYETYITNDKFPIGHGEKSVIMLMYHIRLSPQEMIAIRWHMGSFESGNLISTPTKYSFATSNEKYPLNSILQSADFLSAMQLESKKE